MFLQIVYEPHGAWLVRHAPERVEDDLEDDSNVENEDGDMIECDEEHDEASGDRKEDAIEVDDEDSSGDEDDDDAQEGPQLPSLDEMAGTIPQDGPSPGTTPALEPHQADFVQFLLRKLALMRDNVRTLTVTQSWGGLPAGDTAFHHMLDGAAYDLRLAPRIALPSVVKLNFCDVHPKLVFAFLRSVALPNATALGLQYDIAGQPDRWELLYVLAGAGRALLARLTEFHPVNEIHCHRCAVLRALYAALPCVTEFTLHYWADCYNCEEWLRVLRAQWRRVAARPAAGVLPYLPAVRVLTTYGITAEKLRGVLAERARTGRPIREVVYEEGYILQHERDLLAAQLDSFRCEELITPDAEHYGSVMQSVGNRLRPRA